jgi:hypothetical protein
MIKETTRSHRKMLVLVMLASVALLTSAVHAATLSAQLDDLVLGFRATGGQGAGLTLPGLVVQDLVDDYGANWGSRTDLWWGAAATDGNAQADPNGKPASTLWATGPGTAPLDGTSGNQQNPAGKIEELYTGGIGSLNGATSTSNSSAAASIGNTQTGSWSVQETSGNSFGYFSPKIDGQVSSQDTLQLYELQPTNAFPRPAGADIGELVLSPTGVAFIPEPSTWMLVGLGLGMSVMLLRRKRAVRA